MIFRTWALAKYFSKNNFLFQYFKTVNFGLFLRITFIAVLKLTLSSTVRWYHSMEKRTTKLWKVRQVQLKLRQISTTDCLKCLQFENWLHLSPYSGETVSVLKSVQRWDCVSNWLQKLLQFWNWSNFLVSVDGIQWKNIGLKFITLFRYNKIKVKPDTTDGSKCSQFENWPHLNRYNCEIVSTEVLTLKIHLNINFNH